jgi:DNA-binding SARP family transcriptional activator
VAENDLHLDDRQDGGRGRAMRVEFRLLGEVCARVDGRPVDVGPSRQRYVLAALLAEANHPLSMDQLAERVWGEDRPAQAAA